MTQNTVGVDICKDHLDAHRFVDGAERRFDNSPAGCKALLRWLAGEPVECVLFEATGAYHRDLEWALHAAALPAVKVNPRQARRFAEAIGTLAKTDRLDAAVLAKMAAVLELEPNSAPDPILSQLKELNIALQALIKDRTAAKNRAKQLRLALLKRQTDQRLKQIERQIKAIETEMREIVEQDQDLVLRLEILLSIPGIAERTAITMIIEMPELGSLKAKPVAALTGLAPITRQSGKWKGKAAIQGGRASLRHALYMPALVAIRFNPDMKAKYEDLTKAGKPNKVAITAIMRNLIILANALIRDRRNWTPHKA